ncbi:hypothetical protein PASE110613_09375 [Paenibacillus sediminis]|uniref:Uncharacterized protein n=1 Tax=Paenibacillus sediminis TaxID=664909 RepID=A0ABS4H6N1_9BACL|nr:hypothetical protein [Paenibacillus sediminis]MBP1938141.1 hypothetical protein [Paenibacillus sediminis]
MNANNAQNYRSDRRISVGMTVDNVRELPKASAQLKRFLTEIDVDHGPFDLNIVVSVGGYDFPTIEIVAADVVATEEEGD